MNAQSIRFAVYWLPQLVSDLVGSPSSVVSRVIDREFFPDRRVKSNFLVNIGYGDPSKLPPHGPRLAFEEAVQIL